MQYGRWVPTSEASLDIAFRGLVLLITSNEHHVYHTEVSLSQAHRERFLVLVLHICRTSFSSVRAIQQ